MLVIPTRSWGTFGVWGALLSRGLSMYPVAAQIYGVGTSYVQYVLFCRVGVQGALLSRGLSMYHLASHVYGVGTSSVL